MRFPTLQSRIRIGQVRHPRRAHVATSQETHRLRSSRFRLRLDGLPATTRTNRSWCRVATTSILTPTRVWQPIRARPTGGVTRFLATDEMNTALTDLRGTAPRRAPTVRVLANYAGH